MKYSKLKIKKEVRSSVSKSSNEAENYIESLWSEEMTVDERSVYTILVLSFIYLKEEHTHYFITENQLDFFVSSVRDINEIQNINIPDQIAFFHFENHDTSSAIIKYSSNDSYAYSDMHGCCFFKSDLARVEKLAADGANEIFIKKLKGIIGFYLYLQVFSNSLKKFNLKPKGWKDYKGEKLTIREADLLRDDIKNSISPHYRRGHFRHLMSDRFKEKKTIFIKGTFVKGTALQPKIAA